LVTVLVRCLRELGIGRVPGLSIAAASSGYSVVASVLSLNRDEYLDARRRYELQSIGWLGLWDDRVAPE
jgi:hypothetical protein